MKSIALNFLILLLSTISYGQIVQTQEKAKLIEHNVYPPKVYPDIYVKIDTHRIKLDIASIKLIKPDWIKKVVVFKTEKERNIFGNTNPTLMIYPKRKYKKEILIVLDQKKIRYLTRTV
jgi:hypothetical protein